MDKEVWGERLGQGMRNRYYSPLHAYHRAPSARRPESLHLTLYLPRIPSLCNPCNPPAHRSRAPWHPPQSEGKTASPHSTLHTPHSTHFDDLDVPPEDNFVQAFHLQQGQGTVVLRSAQTYALPMEAGQRHSHGTIARLRWSTPTGRSALPQRCLSPAPLTCINPSLSPASCPGSGIPGSVPQSQLPCSLSCSPHCHRPAT